MKKLCVFCGSSSGAHEDYRKIAELLGTTLAQAGIGLVYGGASVGLMGEVANATLTAGGQVIGVLPQQLSSKEIAHQGLSEIHIVESLHERKAMMERLSDGFIALPGGFGTLDELFEILTWAQLGLHQKPVGTINVRGYFDALYALVEKGAQERFVRAEHRGLLLRADSPQDLLSQFQTFRPLSIPKWIRESSET